MEMMFDQDVGGDLSAVTADEVRASRDCIDLLSRLSAELAHSSNNALGVASANLSLALMDKLVSGENGREMLGDSLDALARLQLMVRELSVFACPDPFVEDTLDLGAVLGAWADAFRAICGRRAFALDIAPVPMLIRGSSRHLVAAIQSLLPAAAEGSELPSPEPVIVRCLPGPEHLSLPAAVADRIELSVSCVDYGAPSTDRTARPRLLSRNSGYLELGRWYCRHLALASGGRFFHALDAQGWPTRMVFTFPAVAGDQGLL